MEASSSGQHLEQKCQILEPSSRPVHFASKQTSLPCFSAAFTASFFVRQDLHQEVVCHRKHLCHIIKTHSPCLFYRCGPPAPFYNMLHFILCQQQQQRHHQRHRQAAGGRNVSLLSQSRQQLRLKFICIYVIYTKYIHGGLAKGKKDMAEGLG